MKKYLIIIMCALVILIGGVSFIAIELATAEYSPNIFVTVENNSTVEKTHSDTSSAEQSAKARVTSTSSITPEADSSQTEIYDETVYITPYGLKYHKRQTCAGKNATKINLVDAKKTFDPCNKCAN